MGKAEKGMQFNNTENWTAEIFSPPYRFIDRKYYYDKYEVKKYRDRTTGIASLERISRNRRTTFKSKIGDKDYYLLASNQDFR